jgi:hypothetical protein
MEAAFTYISAADAFTLALYKMEAVFTYISTENMKYTFSKEP